MKMPPSRRQPKILSARWSSKSHLDWSGLFTHASMQGAARKGFPNESSQSESCLTGLIHPPKCTNLQARPSTRPQSCHILSSCRFVVKFIGAMGQNVHNNSFCLVFHSISQWTLEIRENCLMSPHKEILLTTTHIRCRSSYNCDSLSQVLMGFHWGLGFSVTCSRNN